MVPYYPLHPPFPAAQRSYAVSSDRLSLQTLSQQQLSSHFVHYSLRHSPAFQQ